MLPMNFNEAEWFTKLKDDPKIVIPDTVGVRIEYMLHLSAEKDGRIKL